MLTARQRFLMRGHPTSPGIRDLPGTSATSPLPTTHANLAVLGQGSDKYTHHGKPGVPRFVAPFPRDYHVDSSVLSSMGKGPKAPGVKYWGELQRHDPWSARNERLRQATIAAYQAGSS